VAPFTLAMKIGDTRRAKITATWPEAVPEFGAAEGDPYPLNTAQKVWFTAKTSPDQDDAQAPIKKATDLTGDNDITFTGNIAYFNIVPADTAAYSNYRTEVRLKAEVQVKNAGVGGEIWTVAEGDLILMPQIQHATT
jgi:hypothetical protein